MVACQGLEAKTNVIDPRQVKAGDRIMGLEVINAQLRWAEPVKQYVGRVQFQGETTVSGVFDRYPCLTLDDTSRQRLPRLSYDSRTVLCFSNSEEIQQQIDPQLRSLQTLRINNYYYIFEYSDYSLEARFLEKIPPQDRPD